MRLLFVQSYGAVSYTHLDVYKRQVQYRADLVNGLKNEIVQLDNRSFRVKQHLQYVEKYRDEMAWRTLEAIAVSELKRHIAPLIVPKKEEELARRFDYLIYSIELADFQHKNATQNKRAVTAAAEELTKKIGIPQVEEQKSSIEKILEKGFWDNTTVFDVEGIRLALRNLIQFIDREERKIYYTNFSDNISEEKCGEAIHIENNLENYRKKVEFYLKEHKDNLAVYKPVSYTHLIMTDYSSIASGTTFAELKIFALKKCRVFDVPIALQNQFAAFVTQIDKSKAVIQKSLEETQQLFDSLMQKFFS